jgi:prophage DNA circulation protein
MVAAPKPENGADAVKQLQEAQIRLQGVIFSVLGVGDYLDDQVNEIVRTLGEVGISQDRISDIVVPIAATKLGMQTLADQLTVGSEDLAQMTAEAAALLKNDE